jgi:hypothetical protein
MPAEKQTDSEQLGMILAALLGTEAVQKTVRALVAETLQSWSGDRFIRRRAASAINRRLAVATAKPSAPVDIAALLADPVFFSRINAVLPSLLKGGVGLLNTYLETLEKRPVDEQIAIIERWFEPTDGPGLPAGLNTFIRLLSNLAKADRPVLGPIGRSWLSQWLATVDFGELKDCLDSAGDGIEGFFREANALIWQYPAKLVILLSLIPDAINHLNGGLKTVLCGFNQAPPDLVADIVRSLLRDLDPDRVAGLINEGAELIRKIHTGSALIGEPGSPALSREIADWYRRLSDGIDTALVARVGSAIESEQQTFDAERCDVLFADETRLKSRLALNTTRINTRLKRFQHRLDAVEQLPEPVLDELLAVFIDEFDAREIAMMVDRGGQCLLRLSETRPDLVSGLMDQLTESLESVELQEAAAVLFEQQAARLKPLGRAVVPGLITGLCRVLAPAGDEFEPAAAEARQALRELLQTPENRP